MTDIELLKLYIERDAEGGRANASRTARTQLMREPATVYRWLKKQSPIPKVVTNELRRRLLIGDPVRRARKARPRPRHVATPA